MGALGKVWQAAGKIQLHWRILAGLVLGLAVGGLGREHVLFLGDIGDVFLRALNMVIVPLIATSIVSGVAGLGSGRKLGRLGLKTLAYYVVTSLMAILTGLALVNLIRPGDRFDITQVVSLEGGEELELSEPITSVTDFLLGLIPKNPVAAMAEGRILPVIFFCILVGVFITQLPEERRKPMTEWFDSAFQVMMGVTRFVIAFAPLGVFGLIAKSTAQFGFEPFRGLFFYVITVVSGLAVHFFLTLPLIHWLITRKNPYRFLGRMSPALVMAFSTASSSATLPLTMDCVERRAGVSRGVSSFVLPLGATVNMDGTALYECVAAVFIVQSLGQVPGMGVELGIGQQALIVVTSLLASIGAAGIPMAGLVMIGVILTALGIPMKYLGLIIAIDPILDMMRTSTNVWSDSNGSAVVAKTEGEETSY